MAAARSRASSATRSSSVTYDERKTCVRNVGGWKGKTLNTAEWNFTLLLTNRTFEIFWSNAVSAGLLTSSCSAPSKSTAPSLCRAEYVFSRFCLSCCVRGRVGGAEGLVAMAESHKLMALFQLPKLIVLGGRVWFCGFAKMLSSCLRTIEQKSKCNDRVFVRQRKTKRKAYSLDPYSLL